MDTGLLVDGGGWGGPKINSTSGTAVSWIASISIHAGQDILTTRFVYNCARHDGRAAPQTLAICYLSLHLEVGGRSGLAPSLGGARLLQVCSTAGH